MPLAQVVADKPYSVATTAPPRSIQQLLGVIHCDHLLEISSQKRKQATRSASEVRYPNSLSTQSSKFLTQPPIEIFPANF